MSAIRTVSAGHSCPAEQSGSALRRFTTGKHACPTGVFLCIALLLVGCEKPATTPPATRPATQPAPVIKRVAPPSTRAVNSVLYIQGRETKFPPARIVMLQSEPAVELLIHSNDPPTVLRPGYEENRYYLPLKLDVDKDGLNGHAMAYRAPSLERRDVPDGIFLEGERRQLQPYDVQYSFTVDGERLIVNVRGQFTQFMLRDETGPPQVLYVQGTLSADLAR